MKLVAVVQARLGSVRFPSKVLADIGGFKVLQLLLLRLRRSRHLDDIIVATSDSTKDDALANYVIELGFKVHRGSETDVLARTYDAARSVGASAVVRVTGDCPLVDPKIVDSVIDHFLLHAPAYVSNTIRPTYPDGLDVSVTDMDALAIANAEATEPAEREHVVTYIRNRPNRFKCDNVEFERGDFGFLRLTIDERDDLVVVKEVVEHLEFPVDAGVDDILEVYRENPSIFERNLKLTRNSGSVMSGNKKFWRRAQASIPGGNSLFSKKPELYSPSNWPTYYSKAKDCYLWDLEGKRYTDVLFAVGTNMLGYANSEVDAAVHETIRAGVMTSLNPPEEVFLAEKLVDLHPWASMARFARSGGEANSIAIRIARAASGRDNVAVCGYHGWHDWYLAANIGTAGSLNTHLLPGLTTSGVPTSLKNTVFPFEYNNFAQLQTLVEQKNIGVIKMEVMRNMPPINDFLENVRKLATQKGIVLIFDECTSGFRQTFGGLHLDYGVYPDMAMFGKALGNGYAITSVLGTEEVMKSATNTFISSTFWGERLGFVAAIKTLEIMERDQTWQRATETGLKMNSIWARVASRCDAEIDIFGIPALTKFKFDCEQWLALKTFISQEMVKRGYLASNIFYATVVHSDAILSEYEAVFEEVVVRALGLMHEGRLQESLDGPLCQTEFGRLN